MIKPEDDRKLFIIVDIASLEDIVKKELIDELNRCEAECEFVEYDGYKNCFKVISREDYIAKKIGASYYILRKPKKVE